MDREEPLVGLIHVVRRVLSARTRDPHLVEDLTQETLVRVAGTEAQLSTDEMRAYAIVTARNLLASHGRGESVRSRHAHRLVEYTQLDGPEHLTLEREQTDALAEALERLDTADRDLLLRHETDGIDLATLAAEAGTSSGAVAMRLSRARALLRLEFLLAFRHLPRPASECRAVLLALSAGDQRRQEALDAPQHLRSCDTCAQLASPVTRRDRRIAGWLIVPLAEAARRLWKTLRSHPASVAVAASVVIAAGAVIGLGVLNRDDGAPSSAPPSAAAPTTTPAPPSTRTAPTTSLAAAANATAAAPPTSAPGSSTCGSPLPVDQMPSTPIGCPVAATELTVTAVTADEGFWAMTDGQQAVWVALEGSGESPQQITVGQRLTISSATTSGQPAGAQPPPTAQTEPPIYVSTSFDGLAVAG